jgi:hypothetical protein
MPLNAQILLSVLAHETDSGDISRTLRATPATYSLSLADGTGENQAQVVWSDSRTLSGASETLNASSLTDDRGTVALSALKAVYVRNASTATLTVTPSGSAAAFGGTHHVRPGGVAVAVAPDATGMAAGEAVVAGSAGATYDIILIGEGTVT